LITAKLGVFNGSKPRGMALLEVIVALTIMSLAALSTIAWLNQAVDAIVRTNLSAAEADAASDYLDRIALWPREDLDRHLGPRRAGSWTVTVDHHTRVLYLVTISDSTNARAILRTVLYRPEMRRVTS
jgi:prepilin-type N-terminal cleavage/methylation domain-containing protein